MPSIYKTIFVETDPQTKKGVFSSPDLVDGPELARNIQAAIEEMEFKGYELKFIEPVNSSVPKSGAYRTYNTGMLLIFVEKAN